jgi:hypothetical protein
MFGFRALLKRLAPAAPAQVAANPKKVDAPGGMRSSRGQIGTLARKVGNALSLAHFSSVKHDAAATKGFRRTRHASASIGSDAPPSASTDPDAEHEMSGDSLQARARRREQARCAAILGSPEGQCNPVLAANLAFKTRATRTDAIAVLAAVPAAAAISLHADRASRNPKVGIDAGPVPSRRAATAAGWDRAFAQANGRYGSPGAVLRGGIEEPRASPLGVGPRVGLQRRDAVADQCGRA